jgi:amino acid transporter
MTHRLTRTDVIMIVIGAIIGWGAFVLPGTTFLPDAGVLNTAIGLAVGGLAIVFIQQGYHVMFRRWSGRGGEPGYVGDHLGRGPGFAVAWSLVLAYTSIVALNGLAFVLVLKKVFGPQISAGYLYTVAGFPVYATDIAIASTTMLLFTWINLRGLRSSARAENILVIMLVINVVLLTAAMLWVVDPAQFVASYVDGARISWSQIASTAAIVPFLFVGFDVVPQLAHHLGFPRVEVTRLAVVGIASGVAIYLALTVLTGLALSPEQAAADEWATGAAVHQALGTWGFVLLLLALVGAVLGGINGFTLAAGELLRSLATDRYLPQGLGHRNARGVQDRAILVVLAISLIAPWAGREAVVYIVDTSSLLAVVAYGATCLVSSRIAGSMTERVTSLIGLACSIGFMVLLLVPGSPGQLSVPAQVSVLVWATLGVVVYGTSRRRGARGSVPVVLAGHGSASPNVRTTE